jgi:hypothetical protein
MAVEVRAPELEKALAKWDAATDRNTRFRARRSVGIILRAVPLLATTDRDRATALLARVTPHIECLSLLDEAALVSAWIALDALPAALEYAAGRPSLSCQAHTAVAAELGRRGQEPEALEHLDQALKGGHTRSDLAAMAPAFLAVTDDPRITAAWLLEGWTQADRGLDALLP